MFQHIAASTSAGHFLAYLGPRGPVAIMECATEAVAQREADKRNALERGAALAAGLHQHAQAQRRPARLYGPEYGDFAD